MNNMADPGPGRAELGFKEAVLSGFNFLATYGLRPVYEEITFIRFESAVVFVNVYHGRASFELGVEFGRLNNPDEKLSLYDVIAWAGAENAEGFGQHVVFQVSNRKGTQEFVPKLARLVQQYAVPFLRGDAGAYQAANELQSRRGDEYVKEVNLNPIRAKAEAAWRSKDYAQVAKLYSSMRQDLSSVEAARLSYAAKHAPASRSVQ